MTAYRRFEDGIALLYALTAARSGMGVSSELEAHLRRVAGRLTYDWLGAADGGRAGEAPQPVCCEVDCSAPATWLIRHRAHDPGQSSAFCDRHVLGAAQHVPVFYIVPVGGGR